MLRLSLALLFNVVLATVCIYALVRGGRPERAGAIINLAASVVSTALRLFDVSYYAPLSAVMLAIDIGVALGFFWLAIQSTRFWPVWAFGFALANIVMSVAASLLPRAPLFAFHTGLGLYAYLALLALALGTYRLPGDATAEQRKGLRPSWRAPTATG